jgi:hypothetical protein
LNTFLSRHQVVTKIDDGPAASKIDSLGYQASAKNKNLKEERIMKKYNSYVLMAAFFLAFGMVWGNADAFRRKHKKQPLNLVEKGRFIFFNETFDGNGRTCGTCHPAENNLMIDPKFIAELPKDDPLFVAEFEPDLEGLERPVLMRKFGLILENLNGFDPPDTPLEDRSGLMRSVPHLFALKTSIGPVGNGPTPFDNGDVSAFLDATGWSGDGSPLAFPNTGVTDEFLLNNNIVLDGSLRSFIQGAIVQHYPKTLARMPGKDFRLATEEELDALQAFLLSLGRQEDIDLLSLDFKSAVVQRGKELFIDDTEEGAKCVICHLNAGAINSRFPRNANLDTNVEDQLDLPAVLVDDTMPVLIDDTIPVDDGLGNPGDGTFNTPPLIEAADTAPFFHNNSITSIEGAVAFFNGPAFNKSAPGQFIGGIALEGSQVVAVAALLRTLNALENIRLSNLQDQNVQNASFFNGRKMLAVSVADTEDAIEVLTGGEFVLFEEAVDLLKEALQMGKKARHVGIGKRNKLLAKAISLREAARDQILK